MPDHGRRVYLDYPIVPHVYTDRLAAIKTASFDEDVFSGK